MKADVEVRFREKVDKSGGPEACWKWAANKNPKGYGTFKVGGKSVLAHRFSYALKNGPIPVGLYCPHKCDNPGCVNPDHLFLGTQAENITDMVEKGRQAKGYKTAHFGERNGRAKLSAAQVDEIRAAYAAGGISQRKLGARFGVSDVMISCVVRSKCWKKEIKRG